MSNRLQQEIQTSLLEIKQLVQKGKDLSDEHLEILLLASLLEEES